MNTIIKNIEDAQLKAQAPEFRVGDTVRVSAKIKEGNRERIQVFEGTVLKKQGTGVRSTFTVRKISNGIGVEKTWPLHSPYLAEKVIFQRIKLILCTKNYIFKMFKLICCITLCISQCLLSYPFRRYFVLK